MKAPVKYGLEGDGSLESIRQFALEHNIDLSKPSEKKEPKKKKTPTRNDEKAEKAEKETRQKTTWSQSTQSE